jgi:outer membrane protein insertion porin family
MKKYFLSSILLILVCTSLKAQIVVGGDSLILDYGNPQRFEVGGVVISGTQFLDEAVLINISGLSIGDSIEVPGEKTSAAIENLWKQGLFSDIKLIATHTQDKKIFFEIKLQERPRLSTFTFTGVSKSEADKIREKNKYRR